MGIEWGSRVENVQSDQIYMFMLSILKMPLNSQNWGFEHLFWTLCRGRRRGRNRAMNDPLEAVKLDPVVGLNIDPGAVVAGVVVQMNTTPGEGKKLGFEGGGPKILGGGGPKILGGGGPKILGGGGRCGRGGDGTWADPPPLYSGHEPAGDSFLPPAITTYYPRHVKQHATTQAHER